MGRGLVGELEGCEELGGEVGGAWEVGRGFLLSLSRLGTSWKILRVSLTKVKNDE